MFIDETEVNLAMVRRYGRGFGSERVSDQRLGDKGKNVTLIGAMSDTGLIAAMTVPGALDGGKFLGVPGASIIARFVGGSHCGDGQSLSSQRGGSQGVD